MKRPVLVGIIIVIIGAAAVLITPVVLAGSFNVRVAKVSFTENNPQMASYGCRHTVGDRTFSGSTS